MRVSRLILALALIPCAAASAGQTLEQHFIALHLTPLPSLHGYRQTFEAPLPPRPAADCALNFGDIHAKLGQDFQPLPISAVGKFSGPVVFAGYGISAETEYGYDDYADLDVRGKVVLAMRFEPHDASGRSRFADNTWSEFATLLKKIETAKAHGAIALLLVSPPNFHADEGLSTYPQHDDGPTEKTTDLPALQITIALADKLLGRAATSLLKLQSTIDDSAAAHGVAIPGPPASGNVHFTVEHATETNCIGVLNGAGPLANQWIIVSAENANDVMDPTCDALLSMIPGCTSRQASRRSILFVALPGEDRGAAGAEALISALGLTKVFMAVDVGERAAPEEIGWERYDSRPRPDGVTLCAASTFGNRNIPTYRICVAAPSSAATQSSGDPNVVADCTQLALDAATQVVPSWWAPADGASDRRAFLGIVPDPALSDSHVGVIVQGTIPDSPAAAAGIQNGDLLVQFNDRPIKSLSDLNDALLTARPGDAVQLRLLRGAARVSLQVKLAPTPGK